MMITVTTTLEPTSAKKYAKRNPGVLDNRRTNADEDGTRTRATFVTRKLIAKQC
jgi:hypothetical protein